jgi:hypothetical protein
MCWKWPLLPIRHIWTQHRMFFAVQHRTSFQCCRSPGGYCLSCYLWCMVYSYTLSPSDSPKERILEMSCLPNSCFILQYETRDFFSFSFSLFGCLLILLHLLVVLFIWHIFLKSFPCLSNQRYPRPNLYNSSERFLVHPSHFRYSAYHS